MPSALIQLIVTVLAVMGLISPTTAPSEATNSPELPYLYQFTGSPQVSNPDVSGGIVFVDWSQIQPQPGLLQLSAINSLIQPWVEAGKKVAIRVMTESPSAQATPGWVFDAGVPSVTGTGGYAVPVYWSVPYLSLLDQMIRQLATAYNGDPNVAWIQAGVGFEGETKVDEVASQQEQEAWVAAGYTNQVWTDTVDKIVQLYTGAFTSTQVEVAVDGSYIVPESGYGEDTMVQNLDSFNVGVQDDGLRPTTDSTAAIWHHGPLVEEEYEPSPQSGDSVEQELQAADQSNAADVLIYGSDIEITPSSTFDGRVSTPG